MALVQSLPVTTDHQPSGLESRRQRSSPVSPPSLGGMGSVSSMIPSHTAYHGRNNLEVTAQLRRGTPGSGRLLSDSSHEGIFASQTPSSKRKAIAARGKGIGGRSYSHEDLITDWNDNWLDSGHSGGEMGVDGPPKLVPVSGQLERNVQQAIIRPTAFKPVVPKSRNAMQYLSPRRGGGLSGSQGNLSVLSPEQDAVSSVTTERRSSYSGARNGLFSQSFTMTDSGRNSLTNLNAYSGPVYSLNQTETSKPVLSHGHSNSDSGRSSSSKSTGSLGSRSQPGISDMGSGGPSPPPIEAYEAIVRDLEEKLRERELELRHLRENLDENEVAICQVYEEKQKRSELEMEELRQSCATKMQKASQKAQRAQQLLQFQIFQLQQEKKKLQDDFAQILQQRERLEERCASFEREHTQLGPRLEETKWEVCQKTGEISLLKQQLKDLQADLSQRVGEVVTLRGQMREVRAELQNSQSQLQEAHTQTRTRALELEVCENELQRRKSENELLREKMRRLEEESMRLRQALNEYAEASPLMQESGYRGGAGGGASIEEQRLASEGEEVKGQRESSRQQVERLKGELARQRQLVEDQAAAFENERHCWEEEKDKVIRYQKQLQQNYVQMYRRNRELEAALRELSLELEKREQDDESSGNEVTFDDVAATEI
ncbi:leucine zipper putative tumor suppressor 2 homolog isoform X1 [Hemibagrus wyckioides]|uniref:leucine zipper putative tumor suppressor 2 homolog isoform X1 n=1 Tax=Hemibagrus wyckioides TaxID=337641 RepID=UPI00266D81EE|nr:leucine zipper putative tumor suppressor 2 homolog isoform X1 [Hemibagrus wyckioides]XP_058262345.1 leucine zipper putative tumor suppressor 2 homolog isoform X1 [Hemibagrus wyckioides]XP_058262347.1 leucine zipper putative tumor suppressor 2 homolog isoform X1 [Hemibagrus wyckioides]